MIHKTKRIRLSPAKYRALCQQVLERDTCCVECGSYDGLECHHIIFRSQFGSDILSNLVTLCKICHGNRHGLKIII